MKRCSMCKQEKAFTAFARDKSKRDGYNHKCRDCQKEYHSTYYTSERIRQLALKRHYSLSPSEYQHMVEQQQGKCKICGEASAKLVVDHKHDATRLVRGLLCPPCNQAIGLFGEDIATMLATVAYLRQDGAYDRKQHNATYQIITTA